MNENQRKAFTQVELLAVLAITSVSMGILLPALGKVRRQAEAMQCMSNQRQIVDAVNLFAMENNGKYPESVATIGTGSHWNWQEPTMMTACRARDPRLHRSISAYLRSYIKDASILFCPNAPEEYKYLQEAWDAGDDWDNPETPFPSDPVGGTYCFYWNYIGFLGGQIEIFRGPQGPASNRKYSKLLVSDYFGYDHWRSPNAFGSCEEFEGATITPATCFSSAYWSCLKSDEISLETLKIKLHAGYTDGHVASYTPSEVVPMWVSITSHGSVPYPDYIGPGVFYLPGNALIGLCSDDTLPGDLNCNGSINFEDLAILAEQWLQPPGVPSADIAPSPADGKVNLLDFSILAENWHQGPAP